MSQHFTLIEFIASQTAQERQIDNTPPEDIKTALLFTMAGLERVRACLGQPIHVNSGFRCPELNAAVGGARDSQHMRGEAVDFVCPAFGTPAQIFALLSDRMGILGIDQLILEATWVHASFTLNPRYQAFKA